MYLFLHVLVLVAQVGPRPLREKFRSCMHAAAHRECARESHRASQGNI